MKTWTLQDAKARFSELVNRAHETGPQVVTKHGKDSVVVVAMKDYRKLAHCKTGGDLVRMFQRSPLAGVPAKYFERVRDSDRKVDL